MIKVIKKIDSIPVQLKELMKVVKEAGGSLEEQMKAQKVLKKYLKQYEKSAQAAIFLVLLTHERQIYLSSQVKIIHLMNNGSLMAKKIARK